MQSITVFCLACFLTGAAHSAIVPFKDSVEIVFTPEDIKKGTDYVLWKVPTVKNNFKTTVKQKLLNRLLSKDLQELRLNSRYQESKGLSQNNQVQAEDTTSGLVVSENTPLQNIQLEVQRPKGVVNSVLKGPSKTEKPQGKVRYFDEKKEITQQAVGLNDLQTKEKVIEKAQKDLGEHVGYSKPSKIKNQKHNFDIGVKIPTDEGKSEDSDSESESKKN
ncbi:hypothetical protein CANMA_003620 [Candida margitis]|uniref:uncharacterized protein n=1 Tax=Candida margitis TaxID=1775924 RepID=UPI002227D10A|nr:uncharacterized protein CANMA_003620 [Candida margitis]KAI5962845.1 hypothetical protein CANMA_003620 [Candida margitis]